MWRAPSPTDLRLVGDFGTSRAPSPTDLGFVGDFGTSGVLSPTDLRCEGDLRDVEGRFSIGIGGLRDVGGAVAYGIWVWWCIGFFGTWRVNLPYHMDCRIAGRRGRRPLRCLRCDGV